MFSPLAMKHVLLQVMTEDLPQVCLTLAEERLFHPDFRPFFDDSFPAIPGTRFREIYYQARSRLEKIRQHIELSDAIQLSRVHVISETELEKTNDWLGQVWERCSSFEEDFHRLHEEEQMITQLEQALANFGQLSIDLGLLQKERMFLDIRIGMVPTSNLDQLKDAIKIANYLLFNYMQHGDVAHVIVIGPKNERDGELGSVLDTAGFRPLPIPPELHDEPDKVRKQLQQRRTNLAQEKKKKQEEMNRCADELRVQLEQSRSTLAMAVPFVQVETAARSSGHLSILMGWIPARDLKHAQAALQRSLTHPFRIEPRNPTAEERALVPSHMRVNPLMAPFATLVKQYGIPRYGEIDPTALFAITFIAMFGMMFGDIGHGVTIALVAWLARHRLKSFTLFAISVGLSAAFFGLMYGSIFGYEEVITAVWISPLSDPLYMLSVALSWGIGFLLMISAICIYNRFVQSDIGRAIFDTNGVISTLLYVSLLYGIYSLYQEGEFDAVAAITSILALLILFAYKITRAKAPIAERLMIALIETFETLTGYISNTLSFLRVAAFSLNHVALAIAVFTLAEMIESTHGHILMMIFGNLFILVLEGAIVAIQALRLEYYEGFSRFYSGDGIEFKPLQLCTGDIP